MFKKAIKHFQKVDPILYSAALKVKPFKLRKSDNHFIDLCKTIINQQLSNKAADTIFKRFENLFRNKNIEPRTLLKLENEIIRSAGISYQKINYLKDLSQKVIGKEIDFAVLKNEKEEIIIEKLTKVKGIGRWSAEMFLIGSLARPDIFSPLDLGLKKAIQKLYLLNERPTPKQLEQITGKWSPFRTYASLILWKSLEI